MGIIERIKKSGITRRFIAKNAGIGYVHLTRVLSGERHLCPKTEQKLRIFAKIYVK